MTYLVNMRRYSAHQPGPLLAVQHHNLDPLQGYDRQGLRMSCK